MKVAFMRSSGWLLPFALLVCGLASSSVHAQQAAAPTPAPPVAAPPPPAQPVPAPGAPPQAAPTPPPTPYPQQPYAQQPYAQQPYPQQAYPQQPYGAQQYGAQPYPQAPGYSTPPPAARKPPRPRRGMMIAGIAVLSASYGVALITGSTLIDTNCCSDVGAMLMIPVAGPFAAAAEAEHGKAVLTLLGAVELVGTGLMIGGIARYVRSKRAAEAEGYYSFALPHGRTLSLDAHTSPRMVGPSMRLRF